MPGKHKKAGRKGLGRTIIDLLVGQLKGTMSISSDKGTTYSISLTGL